MHTNYYVERGESVPHLPVSEGTGKLLLAHKKATPLHQEDRLVVLRLNPEFAQQVSA